jgi:hypothetical protein
MATPKWYTTTVFTTFNGSAVVDIDTGTFKLALVTSAYTPVQDTHNFRDDGVSANDATGGSGYPAGGFTLASVAFTQSTNTLNWDAADISQAITGGPFAFRYGVFYKAVGSAATDNLIGFVDFGAQSITDATLNITLTNPLTVVVS